jgi:hypothetical protein
MKQIHKGLLNLVKEFANYVKMNLIQLYFWRAILLDVVDLWSKITFLFSK